MVRVTTDGDVTVEGTVTIEPATDDVRLEIATRYLGPDAARAYLEVSGDDLTVSLSPQRWRRSTSPSCKKPVRELGQRLTIELSLSGDLPKLFLAQRSFQETYE